MHFAYTTSGGNPTQVHNLIAQNTSIRTLSLDNQFWTFPTDALSIRNLTHIDFFGHFPIDCTAIPAILSNGRQLESLSLSCLLDCSPSTHFRVHQSSLPFLRHFAFTVYSVNRRLNDRDLFPAIAEFLRHRTELRTLHLTVPEADQVQKAVGFDSAIWGVLPSLVNLRGLAITYVTVPLFRSYPRTALTFPPHSNSSRYPRDLSPGLAMWLIPRGVLALNLDCVSSLTRDPIPFLNVSTSVLFFPPSDSDSLPPAAVTDTDLLYIPATRIVHSNYARGYHPRYVTSGSRIFLFEASLP